MYIGAENGTHSGAGPALSSERGDGSRALRGRVLKHSRRDQCGERRPHERRPGSRQTVGADGCGGRARNGRERDRRVEHRCIGVGFAHRAQEQNGPLRVSPRIADDDDSITGYERLRRPAVRFHGRRRERFDDPHLIAAVLAHRKIDVGIAPVVLRDRAFDRPLRLHVVAGGAVVGERYRRPQRDACDAAHGSRRERFAGVVHADS